MNLLILNNPANLLWQTNILDLLMTAFYALAVVHALAQFRRGARIYAYVLVTAQIYGIILELAGMATVNLYLQGNFVVMVNFPAIPLFAGTTAMPLYVTLYYPVIFTLGFKIVEALGIRSIWHAAAAGGLYMVLLEAPFVIEGNLTHIRWFTWATKSPLLQYFVGWPLADMAWQSLWGATFYYIALRIRSRVDGSADQRWSNRRLFSLIAPAHALAVMTIGTALLIPVTVLSFIGPQWPALAFIIITLAVITVVGLRSAAPPSHRIDALVAVMTAAYVMVFAAMVVANIAHEHGVALYAVVQVVGLAGISFYAAWPAVAARRTRPAPHSASVDRVAPSSVRAHFD